MKSIFTRARFLAILGPVLTLSWSVSASQQPCADLIKVTIPHAEIVLAERVFAGTFNAPDGKRYEVPAFCRVHGVARPSPDSHINFEVWLPANTWNGRYYQVGTGGFAGRLSYGFLAEKLAQGNAVAGTDTGHTGEGNDASWALGHPEKIIDYGYRALKETTIGAKAVINAFYNKAANYSYFEGCSNGGREAMMVAQRYPEDWDGILAGAPANFLTLESIMQAENEIQQWSTPDSHIPHEKLPMIQQAALASCAPEAHLLKGVAADPRHCEFDPSVLLCKSGADNNDCLTANQVATVKKIYRGLTDPDTGESLYPGYAATFEAESWPDIAIGKQPAQTPGYFFGNEMLANMVFDDPDFDIYQADFRDTFYQLEKKTIAGEPLRNVLNSNNPDLRKFQNRKGKLIVYHGWGDTLPSPGGIVNYYGDVMGQMGGLKATQSFFRLFMVPGMGHCSGGPGANSFGQLAPYTPRPLQDDAKHNIVKTLEAWVEKGQAPEKITATKYVNDKPEQGVAFTRPLCPYPQIPVYKGFGSTDLAENFKCVDGEEPIN
jgi:hypothetical protein